MAHLLVIGGSGRTGRLVITEALRTGHSVTALVRDPTRVVPGDRLTRSPPMWSSVQTVPIT